MEHTNNSDLEEIHIGRSSMRLSSALITSIFLLTFAGPATPAELRNQFEIGRNYYESGEFKQAIFHFQSAIKSSPDDARSYFWLGKSYETLALIDGPILGGNGSSKARKALERAVQLAPENREYRDELFDFLINAEYSRNALSEAEHILQTVSESDPDYRFMQFQLQEAHDWHAAPEHRAGAALILKPLQIVDIARRPLPVKHPAGM